MQNFFQSQHFTSQIPGSIPIYSNPLKSLTMLGVSTYCLHGVPLDAALEQLSGITSIVEVMDEGYHYLEDPSVLESYSLDYTIHAPYHGINIASIFETIRRSSIEVMLDCFYVAAEMGANVIVHPGYYAWEQERPSARRQFNKSRQELTNAAEDFSLTFYFENMGDMDYFFLRTPDELELIGDTGLALDVGHANLNHCLPDFLETTISHMHIHDNNGKKDSHSPVGEGDIDFGAVLSGLRRNRATAVLEIATFEGVVRSMEALEQL
jgi:sugar phosphate isomerase/epimerase